MIRILKYKDWGTFLPQSLYFKVEEITACIVYKLCNLFLFE